MRARSEITSHDPTDLYLSELSQGRLLTREDEVELGRRIEEGERAQVQAWVRSPAVLHIFASLADAFESGASFEAWLDDADAEDAYGETAGSRLAQLFARARAILASSEADASLAELATELFALRPSAAFAEHIERALREAAERAEGAGRAEILATLAATRAGRRASAQAKAELVQANLRLVVSLARRQANRGIPLLDLVQEGNLGLMRAADKFDYRLGHRFSTYAAWWIKQAFSRAVLGQGKVIRMPAHLAGARRRVLETRKTLLQEHGAEPSAEELAEHSGVSLEQVKAVRGFAQDPLSLDAPVGDDGDAVYGDFLTGDEVPADEAVAQRRLLEQAREALATMTPREREVLRLRFGLDGEEEHTLQEIGDSFSLSRERVRQIEAQALQKLRLRAPRLER